MQDFPLTINFLFEHGRRVHADAEVVTWTGDGPRVATFATVADRADRVLLCAAGRVLELGRFDDVLGDPDARPG